MLLANLAAKSGLSLLDRVAGVITLGTPHRGSGSQPVAAIVARIASTARFGEDSKLIECTSKDSEVLNDVIDDFALMARNQGVPIFCFFEQHKSDIAKVVRPRWASWWKVMVSHDLIIRTPACCLRTQGAHS